MMYKVELAVFHNASVEQGYFTAAQLFCFLKLHWASGVIAVWFRYVGFFGGGRGADEPLDMLYALSEEKGDSQT